MIRHVTLYASGETAPTRPVGEKNQYQRISANRPPRLLFATAHSTPQLRGRCYYSDCAIGSFQKRLFPPLVRGFESPVERNGLNK